LPLDDSAKPFVMDVDFTATFDQPMQGHLRLQWESKDRWWSKVTWGPFEQVRSLNGDKSYTLQNGDFTPLRVHDLMNLLHVGRNFNYLVAKKHKHRVVNGLTADCIEAARPDSITEHDICVDVSTNRIVEDTNKNVPEGTETRKYSDYVEFGGRAYPTRLELDKGGTSVITANVMELREEVPDPNLLVPPAGAIVRRACSNPTWPESVSMPA
jgi:hypothetical protein